MLLRYIIFVFPVVILGFGMFVIENQYRAFEQSEVEEIKKTFEIHKDQFIKTLNTAKKTEHFQAVLLKDWKPDSSLVIPEIHGVGEDDEIHLRQISQLMIDEFGFSVFGMTLSDGRMYFLEPFESQKNLTLDNFSGRQWFEIIMETKKPFISDVFISAATGDPNFVVSTPILDDNGNVVAIFGGSYYLNVSDEFVYGFSSKIDKIIISDNNGVVVVDSSDPFNHGKLDPYLQDVSSLGDYGYEIDDEKGIRVFYDKIRLEDRTWEIFLTFSEDDFILDAKKDRFNGYLLTTSMGIFIAIIAAFLYFTHEKNVRLTREIERNQEKLVKSERLSAIGEWAARMAHDIRNPLNNIKTSLEILKTKSFDSNLSKYLETVEKNIERIDYTIDTTISFIKSGDLAKEKTDITSFIKEIISSTTIPSNVTVEIKGDILSINLNKPGFSSVVSNLISNSLDAIGSDVGKITIKVDKEGKNAALFFVDSGKGIASSDITKVFDPLFTTKIHGSGLGLATVKSIVENHNGTIIVKNNPTTFKIVLPLD